MRLPFCWYPSSCIARSGPNSCVLDTHITTTPLDLAAPTTWSPANVPFSFLYDSKPSAQLLSTW